MKNKAVLAAAVVAGVALIGTSAARADVITTYTLVGVGSSSADTSITGSFEIDQTTYGISKTAGFVGGTLTVSGGTFPDLDGTYSFVEFDGNDIVFINEFDVALDEYSTVDLAIGKPPFTNGSIAASGDLSGYNGGFGEINQGEVSTTGQPTAVPEPASLPIFGSGLAMLGVMRRKRKTS